MKLRFLLIVIFVMPFFNLFGQNEHGDFIYRASNVHAGNKVRVTFTNYSMFGSKRGDQSVAYAGEWPIGSGKVQLGNTSPYVMSEIKIPVDTVDGKIIYEALTPVIFAEGWDPNRFSHDSLGRFQGFEPLPGFLNISQKEKDPKHAIAMSHQAMTWPAFWPDKMTDPNDPGWKNAWNGYFGKDQKNADEESYFVMDDYQYDKLIRGFHLPRPVPAEPARGGLGLRMAVRGLQWSNPDAEDVIFWLYEIRNFGSLSLDKTVFGANVGASNGNLVSGGGSDNDDDAAAFYREHSLAVNRDQDNIGVGGYTPVPWVGFAFLESPGNPYDGIDNDGDGIIGTGKMITKDDFYRFYTVGDAIVTIDYDNDFRRTLTSMPPEGITFTRNGEKFVMKPNAPLVELPRNGIDDNLNGLIDEADGAVTQDSVEYYLYIRSDFNKRDYMAVDYFTGQGLDNKLIDERRDDAIDNDGDWDPQYDDVGQDGKPGTGDFGEGDGVPTTGTNDLPGEPNLDRVDVDESDQIGLTSFKFYKYGTLEYSNDDQMWDFSRPGYFDKGTLTRADWDYVFSSGYFPLKKDQKEFFSMALIYGADEIDILKNKKTVQDIYNTNYNFAIAPVKPKVTAVAGDGKITLTWDSKAEESFDRFLKVYDFEGYKIYKASHYDFGDAGSISDGLGYERFKKPLAIYDKMDGVYGYFPKDFGTGSLFNLGNESGLTHTFVDEDVINGVRYYYAVTAFDKGDADKNIGPSECTMFVSVDQTGKITMGENVVSAVAQAPAAGYEAADFDVKPTIEGGAITNGFVGVNLLYPDSLVNGDEYELQFMDQSMDSVDNDFNKKIDKDDPNEILPTNTTAFILKNLTQSTVIDTVWIKEYQKLSADSSVLVRNLYEDADRDPNTLTKIMGGMEIFVKNPAGGVISNEKEGILKGKKWSSSIDPKSLSTYDLQFSLFDLGGYVPGTPYPRNYEIVFSNDIIDTSEALSVPIAGSTGANKLPATPVNFKVYDKVTKEEVHFAMFESKPAPAKGRTAPKGIFSAQDRIVFFETLPNNKTLITYQILNNSDVDTTFFNHYGRFLGTGDTLSLHTDMPFSASTRFKFKVRGQRINNQVAKNSLAKISVVPNPYVVTSMYEPHSPYSSGRGPRQVQFINLPDKCTIRIFALDGTLVRQLDHNTTMSNGSEPWDLMTKENMDVAYGVYIYHIDAPGVGEHVGRLLLIK